MTQDAERAYVKRWAETGRLLEEIRWRELRALDDAVALKASSTSRTCFIHTVIGERAFRSCGWRADFIKSLIRQLTNSPTRQSRTAIKLAGYSKMPKEPSTMSTKSSVIHSDPEILSGTPVFIGTRVPVQSLFDYLEGGDTVDEFLRQFPSVKRDQAIAALEFPRDSLLTSAHSA
jgi:uncharacterized protein (DUF433 family)